MKKIRLEFSSNLINFLREELSENYEIEGKYIIVSYHNDEDLFDIGIEFGKWLKSKK
jgi:hypothetical protein